MTEYDKNLVGRGSVFNGKGKLRFEAAVPFMVRNRYNLFIKINSVAGGNQDRQAYE